MSNVSHFSACERAVLLQLRNEPELMSDVDHSSHPQVAVIGAGYWGVNHVRNYSELGALGMVCDTNETSLARVARTFPDVRTESDFGNALSDPVIRGVVIATPAETHYQIAAA